MSKGVYRQFESGVYALPGAGRLCEQGLWTSQKYILLGKLQIFEKTGLKI